MTNVYPSKGWILDFFSCQGQNQLWTKLGLRYTLWLQLPETITWLKILLDLDPRVLTAFPWLHLPNIFPKSAAQKLVLFLYHTQRSFFCRQFVLEFNVRCRSIWTHLQIKSQYLMKFWQWNNILLFVLQPQEVLFFTKYNHAKINILALSFCHYRSSLWPCTNVLFYTCPGIYRTPSCFETSHYIYNKSTILSLIMYCFTIVFFPEAALFFRTLQYTWCLKF